MIFNFFLSKIKFSANSSKKNTSTNFDCPIITTVTFKLCAIYNFPFALIWITHIDRKQAHKLQCYIITHCVRRFVLMCELRESI